MRLKKRYLFLPVLVVPFLYLIFQIYADVKNRTIREFNGQQLTLARQAAHGIEIFFNHYRKELTFFSSMEPIIYLSAHGKKVMQTYYANRLADIKAITRVSAKGEILYTVPVDSGAVGRDISYQEHIRTILKNQQPVVSDVFKAMQGYQAVALHVPVLKAGVFDGTLAILIPFDQIAKRYIKNIKTGESGFAWVISKNGVELHCPTSGHAGRNIMETAGGFPSALAMVKSMMKGSEGITTYSFDFVRGTATGDIRKLAAYTPIDIGGTYWSLAISTPEHEVLDTLQGFRNRLAMIVFLLVIVGLTYFYFGVRTWAISKAQKSSREADWALRKSEEKYRQLADLLPLIVFEADISGGMTFANRMAYEQFGFRKEDISVDLNITFAVAREERDRARGFFDSIMAGEILSAAEYRFVSRSGREFPGMVYASPIISDGKPVGVRGVVVDLTDIRGTEQALIEEEQKFRTLVEESPLGVSLIDRQGNFIYVNPKFTEIFGYDLNDLATGKDWFKRAYPDADKRKIAVDTWQTDLLSSEVGETRQRTFTVVCRDNTERIINFKSVTLAPGDELVTYEDITEKRQREEQSRQAQRMEAIGTLAGGVAHDFNNLLMGIQGRASLILMDLDASHRHYQNLKSIEEYIQSAAALTNQLLGYARGGKYEVQSTDLNDLVKKQNHMFGRTRKEIAIHADLEDTLPAVEVDRGQMEQVFLDLYLNAWHAMPDGGALYVQTGTVELDLQGTELYKAVPGKYVKVTVRDTGVGMDADTLDKVFNPFFTTRGIGRGTGLGLASAYGILKNHKGFITASSAKGRGTTFKLFIPVSAKNVAKSNREKVALVTGNETILLVDDEAMIIDVADKLLSRLGYEVITADSGKNAIAVYKEMHAQIDLVLLDMIMPEMGGGEVYDQLAGIKPDVKVILSSGYSIDGKAKEILNRGCNGFLQKPFGMDELSSKIREVLD